MTVSLQGEIILRMQSQQVVGNAKQTEDAIGKIGHKADETGKKVEFSATRAAGAMVGLASSAASAFFSFDNLGKLQTRIEKQNLAVERTQHQLNKMLQEGKKDSEEYRLAQEKLRIQQEDLKHAQGNLTQAAIQFGLLLTTMGSSTIPSAISAIRGLSAANAAATASQTGFTASIVASTSAIWKKTVALAANPIFAVATAASVAAAVGLVATNTLGMRDAIFGTTEAIEENTKIQVQYASAMKDQNHQTREATIQTNEYKSSLFDLNKEYERTVGLLKKNDEVKKELNETIFLMGSLASMGKVLESRIDPWSRITKDTRWAASMGVDAGSTIHGDSLDALLATLLPPQEAGAVIRARRATQYGGDASLAISEYLKHQGVNIPGAMAQDLFAHIAGSSVKSSSVGGSPGSLATAASFRGSLTTAAGRSASHGGAKGASVFGVISQMLIQNYSMTFDAAKQLIKDEGLWSQTPHLNVGSTMFGDSHKVTQFFSVFNEASRRRNERMARLQAEATSIGVSLQQYQSMLATPQGMADIDGMKLYKSLAAMG